MAPGDLLLIRTHHFASRLIRWGQRGYSKEYAQWNHVALVVDSEHIVEALTKGVVVSRIDKYPEADTRWVPVLPLPAGCGKAAASAMRVNAVGFAASCVGQEYGWPTILCIALRVLFKGRWNFGLSGTAICSGLAAQALERLGYCWTPYDAAELTPAYLARTLAPKHP